MKAFTTITELDILYHAYHHILDLWLKSEENYSKSILAGNPNSITKYHRDRYHAQLEELHASILELEKEAQ